MFAFRVNVGCWLIWNLRGSGLVSHYYLCNVDNLEVPSNHERDGSEDTNSDVYHGVDCRLLEAGAAPSLALSVLEWSSPVHCGNYRGVRR